MLEWLITGLALGALREGARRKKHAGTIRQYTKAEARALCKKRKTYLLIQKCARANAFPDYEAHRHHKGWRVIICKGLPKTPEGRILIEQDSSRHLIDICGERQGDTVNRALRAVFTGI